MDSEVKLHTKQTTPGDFNHHLSADLPNHSLHKHFYVQVMVNFYTGDAESNGIKALIQGLHIVSGICSCRIPWELLP